RDEVRDLTAKKVELLFWDGDAREVEFLLRQLARDRVAVRICGGEALAPERQHPETRLLLEGVQIVSEDWRLAGSLETRLAPADSITESERSLRTRGWIAGSMLAAAIESGALCPEEITRWLAAHTASDPWLSSRGFLDASVLGARLPVYVVKRGRM